MNNPSKIHMEPKRHKIAKEILVLRAGSRRYDPGLQGLLQSCGVFFFLSFFLSQHGTGTKKMMWMNRTE